MKKVILLFAVFILFCAFVKTVNAQTDTLKKPFETETIEIFDEYKGKSLLEIPYSIGVVDSMDFHRGNNVHLHNTLNIIPGVRMEMRTATSGTRIVIRGYGNQTNFNGIGYKAYLNNIPLTDADGTTTMDDIDFSTLGKVEVIKGPSSSLYGTGIGGVVNMQTEKAPTGTSIKQDLIAVDMVSGVRVLLLAWVLSTQIFLSIMVILITMDTASIANLKKISLLLMVTTLHLLEANFIIISIIQIHVIIFRVSRTVWAF